MKSDEIKLLEGGSYLSLATRKRSGEYVATPVWFAPHEDSYYLFSAGAAGKVKRLRNFSESRIAPCDVRGRLLGNWIDTRAVVLEEDSDKAIALAALRKKYGLLMKTGDIFAKLSGKMAKRAYIKVDLQ